MIIGAGPGGLAASLTTAHRGLTTLVIEAKDKAGGQPQFLYADKKIVDIPGFPDGITRRRALATASTARRSNALVQFRFNEELVTIEDTDQVEKDDRLKRVVTTRGEYLCRKVIIACGLLHYPRRLPVLDALESKNVFYKIPKIGDYEGSTAWRRGRRRFGVRRGVMALERGASVDVLVPRGADRQERHGGPRRRRPAAASHVPCEIAAAAHEGDAIRLTLTNDAELRADYVIVQIGFLSAKETFERLDAAAQRRRQHRHRSLLRNQPPRHLRRRRRPRRHQADHRRLGRRHPGRDLRLQGNHQPLLAQRKAAPRSEDRHDRRKNHRGGAVPRRRDI